MKLYLACNFSNREYPAVLAALRKAGHNCFDFRSNEQIELFGSDGGYNDPNWADFQSPEQIRDFLVTDEAPAKCYTRDRKALEWADAVIAVCPSGLSAASEVSWAAGRGKLTIMYLGEGTVKGS